MLELTDGEDTGALDSCCPTWRIHKAPLTEATSIVAQNIWGNRGLRTGFLARVADLARLRRVLGFGFATDGSHL